MKLSETDIMIRYSEKATCQSLHVDGFVVSRQPTGMALSVYAEYPALPGGETITAEGKLVHKHGGGFIAREVQARLFLTPQTATALYETLAVALGIKPPPTGDAPSHVN